MSDYKTKNASVEYNSPYFLVEYSNLISNLKPNEIILYNIIKNYSKNTGYYYGGIAYLAKKIQKTSRTVYRILDSLEKKKKITRVHGYNKYMKWSTKIYPRYAPELLVTHM